MNKYKRPGHIAVFAAVFMVLAMAVCACLPAFLAWAADDDCYMNIYSADPTSEVAEDLNSSAGVVLDVYRIASAVKDPKYDTYSYVFDVEGFDTLALEEDMDRDKWDALAQKAAGIVKDSTVAPLATGAAEGSEAIPDISKLSEEKLGKGLYLVIARSAELADKSEYFGEVEGRIVSYAQSEEFIYSFAPQLVALPSKGDLTDPDASANTGDSTPWANTVTVYLKSSREDRMTGLVIRKTLSEYVAPSDANFVFRITAEAEVKGETKQVYSRVVLITFTEPGEKTLTLENVIPVGASVKVEEIYEGASYRLKSGPAGALIAEAGENIEFSFVNEPDGSRNGSASANRFTKAENGDWPWERINDESDSTQGGGNE